MAGDSGEKPAAALSTIIPTSSSFCSAAIRTNVVLPERIFFWANVVFILLPRVFSSRLAMSLLLPWGCSTHPEMCQCVAINAERFVVSLIRADTIVSGYYQKSARSGSSCMWSTRLHVLACVIS